MNKAGNDSARVSGQDSKKPPAPWTSQIAGFGGFRPFASLEKHNTSVLLFIQNISPFLIGSNRSANSLQPISVGQIWKIRAIYHRFNGIFDWKRGWSIILSAWKRGCWLGKRTLINLVSRRGPPGCFFMVELKKNSLWLSEDEMAEFLTKTELKKWINRSKTRARFSSGVSNTEKRMKARRRRRSAFYVSRCLEPVMKNEARVFEPASQTSVRI